MMKKFMWYIFFLFAICLSGASLLNSKKAQAKTGSGSCGKNAYWTYDTKSKQLDIFGKGKVTGEINIKKEMHRKRKYFEVKKLLIHEGITELEGEIVLKNELGYGIKEISLPESFQKISRGIFDDVSVKNIYIPRNVSEIEEAAFMRMQPVAKKFTVSPDNRYYCSRDGVLFTKDASELVLYPKEKKNKFYRVPSSVKRIAPLAFAGNCYLENVKLPVDLEVLGGGAFYCCQELKQINISKLRKIKRIRDYYNYPAIEGFSYKESDTEDEYNGDSPNSDAYHYRLGHLGTFTATSLSSFEMPDSLQYIASETFRDCWNLHKFSIGRDFVGGINTGKEFTQKSVSLYYVELRKLTVSKKNKTYQMVDNILYTKDKKTLCQVVSDKRYKKETFRIDKKTTEIGNGAFRRISLYSDIIAEHDLDKIGISAFAASKIRSFVVRGNVYRLMHGAFLNSKVQSFECEGGLYSIPANAFLGCYSLEKILIDSAVMDIGESAFQDCQALKVISFTDSVKRIEQSGFCFCDSLEKLEFRNLEYIGEGAFNCQNLKELVIPESAVIDGKFAISESTKMIRIPSSEVVEGWKSALLDFFTSYGTSSFAVSEYFHFLRCLLLPF